MNDLVERNRKLETMVVALRRAIRSCRTHDVLKRESKNADWTPGVHCPPTTEFGSTLCWVAYELVPSDKLDDPELEALFAEDLARQRALFAAEMASNG